MKQYKINDLEVTDYTDDILIALSGEKEKILKELGMTAEGFAKKHETAVDTGRLRNSLTYQVHADDGEVHVGTNVEYAPYIEFGTSRYKGIHYIEKALVEHLEAYRDIIKKHLD